MSDASQPQVSLDRTLDAALGFEITEVTDSHAAGYFEVEDRVRQAMGLVHGGVYASLAETLASYGTFFAVARDGKVAVGLSNQTNFLRPVTAGTVTAQANCRHRGRTTWVWEVEFTDENDNLCALTRVTMAVRAGDAGQGGREQ